MRWYIYSPKILTSHMVTYFCEQEWWGTDKKEGREGEVVLVGYWIQ